MQDVRSTIFLVFFSSSHKVLKSLTVLPNQSRCQWKGTKGNNLHLLFGITLQSLVSFFFKLINYTVAYADLYVCLFEELLYITQSRPCNIQQYFTAVKMLIFR